MKLIDEQNDVAVTLFYFIKDGFQSLLELAAEFGPGQQSAHVQRKDPPVAQPLRHVALHNALRQTLHDCRLADTGFADEDRIVLGFARQNSNGTANFVVAADHRIKLALPRLRYQVEAILVQSLIGAFRGIAGDPLMSTHRCQCFQQCIPRDAKLAQDGVRWALVRIVGKRQHQMFDRDVIILESPGFLLGLEKQILQVLCNVDLAGLDTPPTDAWAAVQFLLQRLRQ